MNPGTESGWGLHWFRRDLRVAGNPALQWNWKEHGGRTLGFFCFDGTFLSRADFSINRFGFFLETMKELREELRSLGGDVVVLDGGPAAAFRTLFSALKEKGIRLPSNVSWNRDYEPFARKRDAEMEKFFSKECGLGVHTERDHLLIEPEELTKETGGYYQVYSPFAKRWLQLLETESVQSRLRIQKRALASFKSRDSNPPAFSLNWPALFSGAIPLEDMLEEYCAENSKRLSISLPAAGCAAAFKRLKEFSSDGVDGYADQRDFPAVPGTSRLSIYLKNGSITSSQILAFLELTSGTPKSQDGRNVFLKEIIWREFYYHILFHRPDVEHQSFLEKYRNIKWENREDWFEAWKTGRTGYPIVDAGMRQLNDTGWMHNRVRMIVASFLTKDLHIDWRWGERYFMEKLLDGDLAPNNGGWQWAASTGCDPQPYFRIFNPYLQSKKFDPNGDYIRRWVSELKDMRGALIHEPEKGGKALDYPLPIVNHAEQKAGALALYEGSPF